MPLALRAQSLFLNFYSYLTELGLSYNMWGLHRVIRDMSLCPEAYEILAP